MQMNGASAALPPYYCALNLCKAELVLAGQSLAQSHGLRYDEDAASQLRSDRISVHPRGNFASLYRLRVGVSPVLAGSIAVRLDALLARMSEISAEASLLHLDGGERLDVGFALIHEGDLGKIGGRLEVHPDCDIRWLERRNRSVVAFRDALKAEFQPVVDAFYPHVLDTRKRWPDNDSAARGVARMIAPFASTISRQIVLRPPLPVRVASKQGSSHQLLPLPDHLARYMFVFLLSSIVRYVPARFEACGDQALKAVVDLAVDDARTTLLLDSALFMCGTSLA